MTHSPSRNKIDKINSPHHLRSHFQELLGPGYYQKLKQDKFETKNPAAIFGTEKRNLSLEMLSDITPSPCSRHQKIDKITNKLKLPEL